MANKISGFVRFLSVCAVMSVAGCSDMDGLIDPTSDSGLVGSWELYNGGLGPLQINVHLEDLTCYNTTNGVNYLNGTWTSTSYSLTYTTLKTWGGSDWVTAVPLKKEMYYCCLAGSDNQYLICQDIYHRTSEGPGIVGRWQFESGFWTNDILEHGENRIFVFTPDDTYTNYVNGIKVSSGTYTVLAAPNIKLSNTALMSVQTYTYRPMNGSMAIFSPGADRPLLDQVYFTRR